MLKVFDADILVPKDRVIVVGGREFNVKFIPMSTTIKIYSVIGDANQTIAPEQSIITMVDIVYDVLKHADPSVTKDWIMDNVDIRQLNPLFFELCAIMNDLGEKQPSGKKPVMKKTSIGN